MTAPKTPPKKSKVKDGQFDPAVFLETVAKGRIISAYRKGQNLFAQGDDADAIFYIRQGKVKVTVVSKEGKEAIVAIMGADEFVGEGCLIGQPKRLATASAMADCESMRVDKTEIMRVLREEPEFSQMFVAHILTRNARVEEDLVDQLFNSTEKRLARLLLLMANFGKEGRPEPLIAKVSQETLAEMIGTTRSRVSHFMNKFRKAGFIDYNGHLEVHSSLLSVVLGINRELLNRQNRKARKHAPYMGCIDSILRTMSDDCGLKRGDNMTDEIRIEDLIAEHVRRYDRINAVTVTEDEAVCAWKKPPKLAALVSPDVESQTLTLETLNVRIDSMRKEHVKELHDKAERPFKESSVRR